MKAYLIVTGALFTLLALAHAVLTALQWPRVAADPGFALQGPGIGLIAAALSFWAWRLLWATARR